MVRLSALAVTVKANKGFRRKSKRPFYYNGRLQYPRLLDAEKNLRRGERVVRNTNLNTFIIVKDRRFKAYKKLKKAS